MVAKKNKKSLGNINSRLALVMNNRRHTLGYNKPRIPGVMKIISIMHKKKQRGLLYWGHHYHQKQKRLALVKRYSLGMEMESRKDVAIRISSHHHWIHSILRILEIKWIQERELKLKLSQIKLPPEFQIDGMLWKSISFPLSNPAYFLGGCERKLETLSHELLTLLHSSVQDFPAVVEEFGQGFDVVSFLSRRDLIRKSGGRDLIRRNGAKVVLEPGLFEGKIVMVFCFNVPVLIPWEMNFQCIVNLCHELYSNHKGKFEMVMVARMYSLADDEEVFDHFFSGFPELCLAVPYKDSKRREIICKEMGLGRKMHALGTILDDKGKVNPSWNMNIFTHYGGEAFPFTPRAIRSSDDNLRKVVHHERAGNLSEVLRSNQFSPDFVCRFGDPLVGERVPISEFSKNTYVWVLLCRVGDLVPDVVEMYKKCMEAKAEIEVVVVYMPFESGKEMDPVIFKEKMDGILQKHLETCKSWFWLPFDNSVSRRFRRLTHHAYGWVKERLGEYGLDMLTVVGPDTYPLDMYGGEVMRQFGVAGFPFTTTAAINGKVMDLRKFTLQSLLPYAVAFGTRRGIGNCTSGEILLRGPGVILIFGDFFGVQLETPTRWNQSFSMVLIDVFTRTRTYRGANGARWCTYPFNSSLEELMDLFPGRKTGMMVAFGTDGKIRSIKPLEINGRISPDMVEPMLDTDHESLYEDVECLLGLDSDGIFYDRRMKRI